MGARCAAAGDAVFTLGDAALGALSRKENHTVRLNGPVIDIPRRTDSKHATYAGKDVVVKHLLSGDYRVFYGEECIAWANGLRPKPSTGSDRNNDTEE